VIQGQVQLRVGRPASIVSHSSYSPTPGLTLQENFERLHAADLVLDTTVYGAHTGAVDALWAGKPLLTCLGPKCSTLVDSRPQTPGSHEAHLGADCMTARIASSMLVGSGLEEVREITHSSRLLSAITTSQRQQTHSRPLEESCSSLREPQSQATVSDPAWSVLGE